MTFRLSKTSKKRMKGVNPRLLLVVGEAIKITEMDFGVSCGLRTIEQQKKLVAAGKSQTLKSKHLVGEAVDVYAWFHGKISWNLRDYMAVADAFRLAAIRTQVRIRWGAAWEMPVDSGKTKCLNDFPGSAEEAKFAYCALRESQGKTPFIDAPHFELRP